MSLPAESQNAAIDNSGNKDEGGDVESSYEVRSERYTITKADLVRLGHKSIDDFVRSELTYLQGAGAGYNSGVDAVSSLHVGLTDEGREKFKEARKGAIDAFYRVPDQHAAKI